MKRNVLITATIVLVNGLTLSGCTVNITTPPNAAHSHEMNAPAGSSEFSGMDIMFAQMMIPHHQQAIDMSELAETRAANASVLELAQEIQSEQDPEINQMLAWLDQAGASTDMGHEMHMDGMLDAADIQALEQASGAEFDRLYLEGMIAHHEGAIEMAQMILDSKNPEVKALGEAIVESQSSQIEYMRELLGAL